MLLHGDLPAWLVLGHSANLTALRTPPASPGTRAAGRPSRRAASPRTPR
ncbi:hypothetical protein ACFQ0M_44480 [Kitasatospora aburaviensis]